MAIRVVLIWLCSMIASPVAADDMSVTAGAASVILKLNGKEVEYKNIIGQRNGFYVDLTIVNSKPALFVGGRDSAYYTLKHVNGELLLDCALVSGRNSDNGVRIMNEVCDMNMLLTPDAVFAGFEYYDSWVDATSEYTTINTLEQGKTLDIVIGVIGGVEVHNFYSDLSDIKNSSPRSYVKVGAKCFSFDANDVYMVFEYDNIIKPKFLDVVVRQDPMQLVRLDERALVDKSVHDCF